MSNVSLPEVVTLPEGVAQFTRSALCAVKGKLAGRVLTIIDASIADPIQRKAIKDIIHEAFASTRPLEEAIIEYGKRSTNDCFLDDESIAGGWSTTEDISLITPVFCEGVAYKQV